MKNKVQRLPERDALAVSRVDGKGRGERLQAVKRVGERPQIPAVQVVSTVPLGEERISRYQKFVSAEEAGRTDGVSRRVQDFDRLGTERKNRSFGERPVGRAVGGFLTEKRKIGVFVRVGGKIDFAFVRVKRDLIEKAFRTERGDVVEMAVRQKNPIKARFARIQSRPDRRGIRARIDQRRVRTREDQIAIRLPRPRIKIYDLDGPSASFVISFQFIIPHFPSVVYIFSENCQKMNFGF